MKTFDNRPRPSALGGSRAILCVLILAVAGGVTLAAGGIEGYSWDACWRAYRWYALGGVLMSVVASMLVGESERGNAMFATMAARHAAHALDHESLSLVS